jgi:hypothetical protein
MKTEPVHCMNSARLFLLSFFYCKSIVFCMLKKFARKDGKDYGASV